MKTVWWTLLLAAAPLSTKAQARDWERIEGRDSGIGIKTAMVVRSQEEWRALWARHRADRAEPVPPVDFDKEVIVAVFLGARPTAGFKVALEFERDARNPSRVLVRYREVRPSGDSFVAQVMSQPFLIRKVSARDVVLMEDGPPAARGGSSDRRLQDMIGVWTGDPPAPPAFDGPPR